MGRNKRASPLGRVEQGPCGHVDTTEERVAEPSKLESGTQQPLFLLLGGPNATRSADGSPVAWRRLRRVHLFFEASALGGRAGAVPGLAIVLTENKPLLVEFY